jgi:hypothetical protein
MTHAFDPQDDFIRVNVEVEGPNGRTQLAMALDTAATITTIDANLFGFLGYDLTQVTQRAQLTTASLTLVVPCVTVAKLSALGHHRIDFQVLAHTPPSHLRLDGVLGLNFVRGKTLKIDFRTGQIDLT